MRTQKRGDLDACILDPSLVYIAFFFSGKKPVISLHEAYFHIMKGGCPSETGPFIQLLLNPATHTLNKSQHTHLQPSLPTNIIRCS